MGWAPQGLEWMGSASLPRLLGAPWGPWAPGFILREDLGLVSGGWGSNLELP